MSVDRRSGGVVDVVDLVRLVTSIQLAPKRHDDVTDRAAASAVLKGYRAGSAAGAAVRGRDLAALLCPAGRPASRRIFGPEVEEYPKVKPPRRLVQAPIESLPKDVDKDSIRLCSRRKGGGSLGRPRYVAVVYWQGGRVLREAKAQVPSA